VLSGVTFFTIIYHCAYIQHPAKPSASAAYEKSTQCAYQRSTILTGVVCLYKYQLASMETGLNYAHAWFFDSSAHELNGALVIRLVEGIKGRERQYVGVGETKLGPYFPVQVEATSRCAEVTFPNAIAFFVYNESYDTSDPELKKDTGNFLFNTEASSFRKFAETRTLVQQLHQGPYQEFLLCCEDRIFQVLSAETPSVVFLSEKPDLSVERTITWSTN
jgi:hypothetical protein